MFDNLTTPIETIQHQQLIEVVNCLACYFDLIELHWGSWIIGGFTKLVKILICHDLVADHGQKGVKVGGIV